MSRASRDIKDAHSQKKKRERRRKGPAKAISNLLQQEQPPPWQPIHNGIIKKIFE
jgi:hypothetical protein